MDKEIISGAYHTVEFKIMGIFGAKERDFFYEGADRRNAFRAEQSLGDFWKRFYEDKDECCRGYKSFPENVENRCGLYFSRGKVFSEKELWKRF